MEHTYHFTRASGNAKTGPIPVTTTSADSCPPTCSFKGNGCYAESGPIALHWKAVSAGKRGGTLDELCAKIRELPRHQLWRMNQAGDLPVTKPGQISAGALRKLLAANKGRRGFTYTHHKPTAANRRLVAEANAAGFTVNWSAETLEQADEYADLHSGPVVCVLPADQLTPVRTPAGRLVTICPAVTGNTDCLNCGICQQRDRQAIVGFPAHGSGAKRVQKVFFMKPMTQAMTT
ncbi:hypothetical protein DBR23_23500 [Acidovorax sp. HMWF018]|uniref:DUF7227 family protein n=1 Tax=Acidovorax sp. HMWF018 TaxID=2056855 RepID=UPI000D3866D4|nr:hypothetical protein [Acidovorax sp. HMWF018]PTT35473.1 hypothetical protein DBR23_23500 [Acidovorax sp. HMWF018]